ncbi:MAG: PfkB family carbohydrate kinase [Thermoproteota archaeon]
MPRHVALGKVNIDVYLVVDRIPGEDEAVNATDAYIGPGGSASNYSVAVARMGDKVVLCANTGELASSLGILASLARAGIDVGCVKVHKDELPGIVVVIVSGGGAKSMVSVMGANAYTDGTEVDGLSSDVFHVASMSPQVASTARGRIDAELASYDPGGSVAREAGADVARVSSRIFDVLFLNRKEFAYVYGEPPTPASVARASSSGPRILVVKMGSEGAIASTPHGVYRVDAFTAGPAVDTTGAGDVFDAVFNFYLARGEDYETALWAAAVAAGIKVTRRGAQSAPSREEVEKALSENPPRLTRIM